MDRRPLLVATLFGCAAASVALVSYKVEARSPHTAPHAVIRPVARDPAADALFARSVTAAQSVPIHARVVVTRWKAKGNVRRSVIDVLEGSGGRFRHAYSGGRVVVSNGRTVWQYEPRTRTVLRRPAPLLHEASPKNDTRLASLVPGTVRVAGRPTTLLELRNANGRIAERRWVDQATGRSLRTDEYSEIGHLLRRVEMTRVLFSPTVTAATFKPAFRGARTLAAKAEHPQNDTAIARRLDLPTMAGNFALRSVVRTRELASYHLVYSNGARAMSIFVTPEDGDDPPLRTSATWRPAELWGHQPGYVHQGRGHSAIAWVHSRTRYIAVGRFPLDDLLPIVQSIAGSSMAKPK